MKKESAMISIIFIACAFSAGAMVSGALLPAAAIYAVIGGVVLIAIMALFVGAVLGVVWLFKRAERPQQADPYRDYRPMEDRPPWTPLEHQGPGYRIDHRPVDRHVDPWPTLEPREDRRELPTPARREIPWKK